jgi:hypothetical protein
MGAERRREGGERAHRLQREGRFALLEQRTGAGQHAPPLSSRCRRRSRNRMLGRGLGRGLHLDVGRVHRRRPRSRSPSLVCFRRRVGSSSLMAGDGCGCCATAPDASRWAVAAFVFVWSWSSRERRTGTETAARFPLLDNK